MRFPCLLFCAACLCVAQQLSAQTAPDDKVRFIQTVFQQIDLDTGLSAISLTDHEFAAEQAGKSGQLKGYFKGDTLCKATLSVGLSYATVKEYYYFSHGQLVYAYETEEAYGKGSPNFEGRYYFDGYKTLSVLLKGKKKEGPDDVHHSLELYHNANYYAGLLQKAARRRRT